MNPNTPDSCNTSLICRRIDQVVQAVPNMRIVVEHTDEEEEPKRKRRLVRTSMSDEEKRQALVDVLEEALRIVNAPDETKFSFFGNNYFNPGTPGNS